MIRALYIGGPKGNLVHEGAGLETDYNYRTMRSTRGDGVTEVAHLMVYKDSGHPDLWGGYYSFMIFDFAQRNGCVTLVDSEDACDMTEAYAEDPG